MLCKATEKLGDIFKNNRPKPQAEVVTPEGFRVKVNPNENTFDEPLKSADDLNTKIVTVDSKGNPSGIRFRSDYEEHIKFREVKISAKNGISGCHNLLEFLKETGKINIVKITQHPSIKGVYKYEYQMPKLDIRGNPIPNQWRAKIFEKTVYDPRKISDEQMFQLGREAFADAVKNNSVDTVKGDWKGTASNGAKFFGYIDETGAVRSFFFEF